MGKVCYVNGQPYLVSLPRGGKDENDRNNPWDDLINFLGENCNDIFHWENTFSWCQEDGGYLCRAVRGYYSARNWSYINATSRYVDVGFRPVLVPLDFDTMRPDPSLLEGIPDGSRFAFASLYMDGTAVPEPHNPEVRGDIADYVSNATIFLGDRDKDPKNWLHVIKHKDLLWVDRNILRSISWKELKIQGFTG